MKISYLLTCLLLYNATLQTDGIDITSFGSEYDSCVLTLEEGCRHPLNTTQLLVFLTLTDLFHEQMAYQSICPSCRLLFLFFKNGIDSDRICNTLITVAQIQPFIGPNLKVFGISSKALTCSVTLHPDILHVHNNQLHTLVMWANHDYPMLWRGIISHAFQYLSQLKTISMTNIYLGSSFLTTLRQRYLMLRIEFYTDLPLSSSLHASLCELQRYCNFRLMSNRLLCPDNCINYKPWSNWDQVLYFKNAYFHLVTMSDCALGARELCWQLHTLPITTTKNNTNVTMSTDGMNTTWTTFATTEKPSKVVTPPSALQTHYALLTIGTLIVAIVCSILYYHSKYLARKTYVPD